MSVMRIKSMDGRRGKVLAEQKAELKNRGGDVDWYQLVEVSTEGRNTMMDLPARQKTTHGHFRDDTWLASVLRTERTIVGDLQNRGRRQAKG
jgi:hypothetical protein